MSRIKVYKERLMTGLFNDVLEQERRRITTKRHTDVML